MAENRSPIGKKHRVAALVAFLALSAVMYISIMYKIIHYGP